MNLPGPDQRLQQGESSTPDAGDLLFWGLFVAATAALLSPIWTGAIPPLTDFGGQMAMADIWARLQSVEIYGELFRRRGGPAPNLLLARFTGWVHPLFDAITAARLFLTGLLAATAVGMWAVARAFGRSRWLVLLGLPLLWNRSLGWGMLNYIAVFPPFLGAVAAARMAGTDGASRWGVALAAATLASFFAHGLGCPIVIASAAGVLALSLDRPAHAAHFTALAPATGLWLRWRRQTAGRQGLPDESLWQTLESDAVWWSPLKTVRQLVETAHNVTVDHVDTIVFLVLVGLWLLVVAGDGDADRNTSSSTGGSEPSGWIAAGYRALGRRTLGLLVLALGTGAMALPAYIKMTNVNTRLVPLAAFVAVLLPRLPDRDLLGRAACAAAAVLAVGYGLHLRAEVAEFDRRELDPMMEVIEEIPPNQRVECLGVRGNVHPVFLGRPLDLNCPGLVHARAKSFGGFGFPSTGFNAVTFRQGESYDTLRHDWFGELASLQAWDYIVVREQLHRADTRAVTQVHRTESPSGTSWALYRVDRAEPPGPTTETVGGDGGADFAWNCPQGTVVSNVTGWQRPGEDYLGSIRPACRRVAARESTAETTGPSSPGPTMGNAQGGDRHETACSSGRLPVGIAGRSGLFVDRIRLICAELAPPDSDGTGWTIASRRSSDPAGGSGGDPFELTCPPGTVVRGLYGRSGGWLDALGLHCQRIEALVESSP